MRNASDRIACFTRITSLVFFLHEWDDEGVGVSLEYNPWGSWWWKREENKNHGLHTDWIDNDIWCSPCFFFQTIFAPGSPLASQVTSTLDPSLVSMSLGFWVKTGSAEKMRKRYSRSSQETKILTGNSQNSREGFASFVIPDDAFVFSWVTWSKRLEFDIGKVFSCWYFYNIIFSHWLMILEPLEFQWRRPICDITSCRGLVSYLQTPVKLKGFYFGWSCS